MAREMLALTLVREPSSILLEEVCLLLAYLRLL